MKRTPKIQNGGKLEMYQEINSHRAFCNRWFCNYFFFVFIFTECALKFPGNCTLVIHVALLSVSKKKNMRLLKMEFPSYIFFPKPVKINLTSQAKTEFQSFIAMIKTTKQLFYRFCRGYDYFLVSLSDVQSTIYFSLTQQVFGAV